MNNVRDASQAAAMLNLHDPLLVEPLPPSSDDQRFPVSLGDVEIRFNRRFDMESYSIPPV